MASHGRELSSIDFESMLGGPLSAVVNAQAQAAMSSVTFIKEVGFEPKTTNPVYVEFKYPKEVSPYLPPVEEELDDEGEVVTPAREAQAAVWEEMTLTVPILTMLPIPFIRVEETTIDFNAKINSITTKEQSKDFGVKASAQASVGWGFGKASMKVSTSYQSKSRSGSETKRTYSMAVHIRAVQDEMPAGMDRLLGILEDAIKSEPTAAAQAPAAAEAPAAAA